MAASCDLLDVDPPELQFPCKRLALASSCPKPLVLGKQISCPLRLTNRTSSTVAFKVKTTSPRKYCVRPNNGVVPPRSDCTVVVTMQAQTVAPPDLQCKDKFLVQSVVVSDGWSAKDITSQLVVLTCNVVYCYQSGAELTDLVPAVQFMKEGGNAVEEVKLKVTYVMLPEPASEIAEEHDGSERILVPMHRNLDSVRTTSGVSSGSVSLRSAEEVGSPPGRITKTDDFLKTAGSAMEAKASVRPAEQSHELSALIAMLTEEKDSALEQNRKLRDELELVRREVSKQQRGFSLIVVLVVGLLSIILGHFVKK